MTNTEIKTETKTTVEQKTKTVPVPKNPKLVEQAIAKGKDVLTNGGSKADSARAIYEMIESEDRDVIILAFIYGASLTEKGAPTYFYNVSRQKKRSDRSKTKKPEKK